MQNTKETDVISIKVMDRDFKIKCPKDKVADLQKASKYLDSKMREVFHGDKFITIDRIAVAAALNIAHELVLEKQKTHTQKEDFSERLHNIKNKLHKTLTNVQK